MFLDDGGVGNGQALAGSLADRLGGEKRIEDFGTDGFGYATAIVSNTNLDVIVLCSRRNGNDALVTGIGLPDRQSRGRS